MAATMGYRSCSRLLRPCCLSWSNAAVKVSENRAVITSGVRYFRGSNRDTRRRERNLQAKQRKREGRKPKVFDKTEFMEENYDKELFAFKHRLSLAFDDEANLRTALTHETDTTEEGQTTENNTKLSLIGYNLTSHYVTEYLCFKFPKLPSEYLKCLHDFLTYRDTLVKVAELTALPELIKTQYDLDTLDKEKHLNITREDIISDSFLALIGAIYIDQGSQEANKFIQDFVVSQLYGQEFDKMLKFENPELLLESILLSEGREKAEARITRESGKTTHLPVFVVGIFSEDSLIGEAAGYNLVNAKTEAINAALMKLLQRDMHLEPSLPSSRENYKPVRNT